MKVFHLISDRRPPPTFSEVVMTTVIVNKSDAATPAARLLFPRQRATNRSLKTRFSFPISTRSACVI
jgi:hypothetical protein